MDNQLIISDLQSTAGNSLEIAGPYAEMENYKVIELDNKKFLTGDIEIQDNTFISSFEGDHSFNNFDLFLSIVNLSKHISKEEVINNVESGLILGKSKYKQDLLNKISIKNIKDWVGEWGVPYLQGIKNTLHERGFFINKFREDVINLYQDFFIYLSLIYNDTDFLNNYHVLPYPTVKPRKKAYIYYLDDSYNNNYKIHPVYDEKNDTFKMQVYIHMNLISIAKFQFYNFITKNISKDINSEFKHFKKCKYCNNYFWAKDSKQKFCNSRCRKNNWYHENKTSK